MTKNIISPELSESEAKDFNGPCKVIQNVCNVCPACIFCVPVSPLKYCVIHFHPLLNRQLIWKYCTN